ncbi:HAD family hydrolase [Haloimpatiens sp. FM7315]|uniref:HAD family hydrolase n=1 Tax=Haloimpatiens sp. FM7315 TaxID=3298609 RepID=UPI0035A34BE8
MIELIASDLDGTLVNDNGIICPKVYELIPNLHKMGIRFAAASGRFYSQLDQNFNKVKDDMIFIAHNGAIIKYNKKGKTIYENAIDKQDIDSVVSLNRRFGEEFFLAGEENAYVVNPSKSLLEIFKNMNIPYIVLDSFDKVKDSIYKMTYYVSEGIKPHIVKELKKNLNSNIECVVSGDCWIDIMNKGVNKGQAIKMLQKIFEINGNDTMVFGDNYNDLDMFKAAKYSYAMENACEEVKSKANYIAESNNDDGVYKVIKNYITSLKR